MNTTVRIGNLITLKNPVMPASGPLVGDFNKIKFIHEQGVGAIVTKTISSEAAKVPKPCIIGGKNYIINTELWSEFPPEKWENEFLPSMHSLNTPTIISLGYTPEQIIPLIKKFEKFTDAFEISTHYVGKDLEKIGKSFEQISVSTEKPIFIKMSPHIPSPEEFALMAKESGAYGIVATNSLGPVYPFGDKSFSPLGSKDGFGWISGPVIKNLSLAIVRKICKAVDIPVIGVGGISSAEDVIEFIKCGASAVQLLSSAMLKGKTLYSKIINDLNKYMQENNLESLSSIKGESLDKNSQQKFDTYNPVIDNEKCTKCGLCVDNCPYFALEIGENGVEVIKDECFGCGLCESRCPVKAISGVLR